MDLSHPDDEITNPITDGVANRVVEERGTDEHCSDSGGFQKEWHLMRGQLLHYGTRKESNECQISGRTPRSSSAVAHLEEIFHTDHENIVAFQLNDKLAPGAYSYLIIIDGIGLICTCTAGENKRSLVGI